MPEALLRCIDPVTRRLRQVRMWRLITAIAIVFAALAWLMLQRVEEGGLVGRDAAALLLIGLCAAWFAAWCHVRFSFHDLRAIARQIEAKFPSLQQRLLTALGQAAPSEKGGNSPEGELGYLQRQVINEARDHARVHRWADTVPRRRLFWSRITGIVSTAAVGVLLLMLALAVPATDSAPGIQEVPTGSIVVTPGDTAVERGTSLVVTARFGDSVPEAADLVCVDEDGAERRLKMTRNLDDPVLGVFLASVDRPFSYRIALPETASRPYRCDVFEYPSLNRSDATLRYPSYTGMEDKQIEDTVRVAAVEGSSLTWTFFVNKPLAQATLIDESGERVELRAAKETPELLTANFEDLSESQRWTLELVDQEGRKNKYPPEIIARVIPNSPPKLQLTSASDARVSPLEEFPIGAKVRDDYGLARVGFSYAFADQSQEEVVLASGVEGGREEALEHLVEFENLSAQPDQLFSYHFWAEDIGPDGRPRRTESDMFFAEVRPFEEIFREGQQPPGGAQQQQQQQSQNGQQAEELAELQKEIINATWNIIRREDAAGLSDSFVADVTVVRESQAQAIEQLQELASELRDPASKEHADAVFEAMQRAEQQLGLAADETTGEPLDSALTAERAAYQYLLKLRAREFQVTRQQQQQSQSSSSSASQRRRQQQLEQLELQNEENRYETERQAQQSAEQEQQREVRQVLSRLRDLARRQEDLNEQLAELQTALERAEDEEEREEIERQLKRLREQQEEMLREVDELSERMQTPENQETMREASEQLSRTRENVQQATEALANQDASQALAEGTRAEREFEQMRDEFRRRAAGEFNEAVREMRDAAQELDEKQQEVGEQLQQMGANPEPGLRSDDDRDALREQIEQQRERLQQLLNQIQETVQEAETSEPLLAEELYEAFRETEQRQIDQRLNVTSELLKNGFEKEAQQLEREVEEGVGQLRKQLEEATKSVLGDETTALERALGELEQLTRQLEEEIRRKNPDANPASQQGDSGAAEPGNESRQRPGAGDAQPTEGQQNGEARSQNRSQEGRSQEQGSGDASVGQPDEAQQQSPRAAGEGNDDSQRQSDSQNPTGAESTSTSAADGSTPSSDDASPNEQPGQRPGGSARGNNAGDPQRRAQPGLRQPDSPQRSQQRSDGWGGGAAVPFEGDPTVDPLTGEGFREWSDRLRDVEEMVTDPELRSRAAQIRDRAREIRKELRRHSKQPHWPLVEEMVAVPLRELRRDVAEELLRRSAEKNANVPIDRDPVPEQFTDAVRQYYESLGAGK